MELTTNSGIWFDINDLHINELQLIELALMNYLRTSVIKKTSMETDIKEMLKQIKNLTEPEYKKDFVPWYE